MPSRTPGPGEQYRFHFDGSKCIGCHCCEVACSEQNNLPAEVHWRRVGEIEGGTYPLAQRLHLSMGCNHCLEPSCLIGCPVDAYQKDGATGLVLHNADTCIGCQYCVWNCPYGVPQFNPERGVVGKCDMCHGRLAEGDTPACVNACPEQAISIEIVNQLQWMEEFQLSANAPGLPVAETTISTTRITMPAMLPDMRKADYSRVRPEHPHWPLVLMTVVTQFSVGSFLAQWLTGGHEPSLALTAGLLALFVSTLHLGRPIHAYRALKMWRRSWLSREVLFFSCFAASATIYAATGNSVAGFTTSLFGSAGVVASAWIYLVPARPAWGMVHTPISFFLAAVLLGSLAQSEAVWMKVTIVAAVLQTANLGVKLLRLYTSEAFEKNASAALLLNELKPLVILRFTLLLTSTIVVSAFHAHWTALALAFLSEIADRYLFFVSVVPLNIASMFTKGGSR
jgi:formate dehydrogenase iron-sulfur subunit